MNQGQEKSQNEKLIPYPSKKPLPIIRKQKRKKKNHLCHHEKCWNIDHFYKSTTNANIHNALDHSAYCSKNCFFCHINKPQETNVTLQNEVMHTTPQNENFHQTDYFDNQQENQQSTTFNVTSSSHQETSGLILASNNSNQLTTSTPEHQTDPKKNGSY